MADRPRYVVDHVGFEVRDLAESRRFYDAALEPLGFGAVVGHGDLVGIGGPRMPQVWIREGEPGGPVHVAFHADSREAVDAFYAAGLAAGGTDNGAPGLRPQYHAGYYGAYVLDPDGNNVEAVHHTPPG